MNQSYAPPTITTELGRQSIEAVAQRNAFAHGATTKTLERIDGVSVAALAQEFGTPLFVFSERTLREKARSMRQAFTSRYDKVGFAWSYKTNYLNAVCQVFRSEGWIADVTSDFEYGKARKLGFESKELLFNGPYKPRAALERAIAEGALVQIDNWDELGHVEEIAARATAPVDVGLRLCIDAGVRPVWTKFGFALANGEAERAAARVVGNPKLRLHTLHTHIGTFILEPEAYGTATRKMVALRDHIDAAYGHLVPCLNLGGGFPSRGLLHGMTGPASQAVPQIGEYAEAITAVLNRLPARRRPLLRLESGRYLVDEAGYLLTRIVAVKGGKTQLAPDAELSGLAHKEQLALGEETRTGYVIDAGINLLYTVAWFRIEAWPARAARSRPVSSKLYGPLCMAIDVIRENVDLPLMETGDLLTLHPVGAYNTNQSMQFIFFRPAIVMIGMDGRAELVMNRETLRDIDHGEQIPAHLLTG